MAGTESCAGVRKTQCTPSVTAFMAELFPRRSSVALSVAAVFALIAIGGAAWLGYQQYQARVHLENTIAENREQAQTCFAQSDFTCALERSLLVSNLDAEVRLHQMPIHQFLLHIRIKNRRSNYPCNTKY